jgi:hypothetical protein
MTDTSFAVRSADIAHDTIDGESVVIDMAQGVYYRFAGAAALAWQGLVDGAGTDALAALLHARYDADPGVVAAEIRRFVEVLSAEGLIHPLADVPASQVVVPEAAGGRPAFEGLAVHRFSDLQELFWIDPVHEVDDTGWPQRAMPGA